MIWHPNWNPPSGGRTGVLMRRFIFATALIFLVVTGLHAVTDPSPGRKALDAADDAWDKGDYISALTAYIQILNGPGGDAFLEPIALQTGELFQTRELTTDGRAPRFSPDGRFIAYETGLDVSRKTRVVRNDAALTPVADLPGVSATFSPAGGTIAYLKLGDSAELRNAANALDTAPLAGANRNQLVQALAYQILRNTSIAVRDLATGQERETAAPDLLKTGLVYGAGGQTLYFLGAREDDAARTDIFALARGESQPAIVADAPGLKGSPIVDPAGAVLLYVVPVQSPFRRPQPPGQAGGEGGRGDQPAGAGRGGRGGRGQAGAGGGQGARGGQPGARRDQAAGPPQQPRHCATVDLANHKVTMVDGTAPALS